MGLLEGRLALITGATRGIGRAVALRFAAEGADILVAARSNDDLEALDDALRAQGYDRAVLVPFDVSRPDPAIELSNIVHERYGRLDVLVSNAGMLGTLMPVSQMEPAEFDRVMTTNFNALQYQLYAFHDLLRASDAGRIVAVTSGAAVGPRPYWAPYGTAKAAMEFLLQSYAMEVRGTPIRANILDPGRIRTEMRAAAFPGENPERLPEASAITGTFVRLARADCDISGARVRAEIEGWHPMAGDEGNWTLLDNGRYLPD